jgi:hypothetical protein
MMTPTERYLEEFGQKFPNRIAEVIDDFGSPVKNDIKAFIADALERQRKEMIERVEGLGTSPHQWDNEFNGHVCQSCGFHDTRPDWYERRNDPECHKNPQYRLAIDDVLSKLSKEEK